MSITVQNVYDLARTKCGDSTSSAEWMTDAMLLIFINEAYRFSARFLRSEGMGLLRKISASISITAGGGAVTRAVAPVYPTDMIRPYELQERLTTGPGAWQRMNEAVEGFFPETAATTFDLWDWRDDTIYVKPSSVNRDIRISYEAELTALATTASVVLIPDSLDPMAKLVASYALRSRDEVAYAKELEESAIRDLALIAKSEKALKLAKGGRWNP